MERHTGIVKRLLPTDAPTRSRAGLLRSSRLHKFTTDFGIFQFAYSGTPLTSIWMWICLPSGDGIPPSGAFRQTL